MCNLHTQPNWSEIVRIKQVGVLNNYQRYPAIFFHPGNFRVHFTTTRCGASNFQNDQFWYDSPAPGIGNIGDTVEIGMELYNFEMRIKVGDTVTTVNGWDLMCTDPSLQVETVFEFTDIGHYAAGADIFDYSYEKGISGHIF